MDSVMQFFQHLIDPEKLILYGGVSLVLLVIFIENGMFFGFFLPGDTLLFTAGILCATDFLKTSILFLLITVSIAGIAGSLVGYIFGRKMGEALLDKKDSLLFKKKYIFTAEAFFNQHGGLALIMGRFLPIIRTFAPIFAGIVKFDFRQFMTYNIAGGILWVFSMLLLGYFLGNVIPNVKESLHYIIMGIIVITWIPVIRTYLKERKKLQASKNEVKP